MKLLRGDELASFIKERQGRQVRGLRQAHQVFPKLAIVVTIEHPAIEVYMRMKNQYGADILIDVVIHRVKQTEVPELVARLNSDDTVHGIIIQLPLEDTSETDKIVNLVAPEKDVDALGAHAVYDPATPMAILWLLAGYNVELQGKNILLVGRGKLVGAPLEKILEKSGMPASVADEATNNLAEKVADADIIITATGSPGVITADMVKPGAVVVDAGVAGEQGKTVGDLDPDIYERDDITVTPQKGGVGPLTICALFDNVIRAAYKKTDE